jgi:hypothetical protein
MPSLSSTEIAQLIANKENEIKESLSAKEIVDQEDISIARQILELRLKKKDIESALSKATHNVRQLELERKQLEKQFWATKNSGL